MRSWCRALVAACVALVVQCEGGDVSIGVDRKAVSDAGEGGLIRAPLCPPCSDDLHAVIDCAGNPKLVCPPELACAPDGACVEPCQGAAQDNTTLGCDFMMMEPDVLQANWQGACHALLVANAWEEPLQITLERSGSVIDAAPYARVPVRHVSAPTTYELLGDGKLAPHALALVMLGGSSSPCPFPAAFASSDLAVHGTARGAAVHVRTTRPVALVDLYPWTTAPDGQGLPAVPSASLLHPISSWGTTILGVTGWPANSGPEAGVNAFWSAIAITSAVSTTVTLQPQVNIVGGTGVMPAQKFTSRSYNLAAGELLQLEQYEDLSGVRIRSADKITAWGTHQCMTIPINTAACDGAHQELVPSTALGSEYVGVRYATRPGRIAGEESVPWRMVALSDGTQLTYDPPINAPSLLKAGITRTFESAGAFVVRSQDGNHPFYMSAQMTGYGANLADNSEGDPESVSMVPTDQWATSYRFAIDPTYRNVSLVVVRRRSPRDVASDVVLDCAGALGGWTPIGGEGKYDYTRVDVLRAGAAVGACDFGSHLISSSARFTATVWGTDAAASYAYPIGARTVPINDVGFDVNPPQ